MIYTNRSQTLPENIERKFEEINKPAVSVTLVIATAGKNSMELLLIKRQRKPFLHTWSLPGDIITLDESLDEAARRVLEEKTGMTDVYLEQLYTFGDLQRDPRGRLITIAYFALLPQVAHAPNQNNILPSQWCDSNQLPELAFDHEHIISFAKKRIQDKIRYSNIASSLLPKNFRLSQAQAVYESLLEQKLDKRNFRKLLKHYDLVQETGEYFREGAHRPAKLYQFKNKDFIIFR